jgi:quercetin dioxygenase-like cupin family protein
MQKRIHVSRAMLAASLTAVLILSTLWTASAQRGAPARFNGGVSESMDAKDLTIARRRFAPGVRTAWHSHEKGQLIMVERGRMRVQARGQAIKELGVNETDYTGPNVEHWHGAAPATEAIQINAGFGGVATWLEDVTDAQYNGRPR